MNIWCLIPARKGSVGVKDKNIKPLPDGTTLLGRAVGMAAKFAPPERIIVSTDYKCLVQADNVGTHDVSVILDGPTPVPWFVNIGRCRIVVQPRLCASGGGSMLALMTHAILEVGAEANDVVLLLQPTSPFRTEATGRRVLQFAYAGSWGDAGGIDCDSACSAMPYPTTWHPRYAIGTGGEWNPPKRRQDLAHAYRPDGGYYATTIRQLLTGSWGRMGWVESYPDESLTIDTPEDWAEAERRMLPVS